MSGLSLFKGRARPSQDRGVASRLRPVAEMRIDGCNEDENDADEDDDVDNDDEDEAAEEEEE